MNYTNIKSTFVEFTLANRKTSIVIFSSILFVLFFLFKTTIETTPDTCKRYCTTVSKLPSESQYFSGIDNYQDRFPERVKKFREMKKIEEAQLANK